MEEIREVRREYKGYILISSEIKVNGKWRKQRSVAIVDSTTNKHLGVWDSQKQAKQDIDKWRD